MNLKFSDQDGLGVYKKCCGTYLKSHILQLEQGYDIYSSTSNQHIQLNIMLQMSIHWKLFIIIFHLDRGHHFNYIHHTIHRCVDAEHSALFLTQRWWKYWQRLSTIRFAGSHLYVLVYLWIFSKYPYIAICSFSDFVSFWFNLSKIFLMLVNFYCRYDCLHPPAKSDLSNPRWTW